MAPPTFTDPAPAPTREQHEFLLEIGRALALAGTAVSETQERLTRIAAATGAPMPASSCCRRRC